ncbi:uncharacterized protein N7483_012377 [Penicillium malachiteum]|uniref:uncharacterized protein n=1 Tax=Penicillium malachiteum TaxID=1324776 RepID=UPI002546827F|nr:uncharacterized protein N7483_012377 [Penicillium malachiteum]KAJ5715196.1 hypothetical protein N7483_012377 [Penicillium malachiteum]
MFAISALSFFLYFLRPGDSLAGASHCEFTVKNPEYIAELRCSTFLFSRIESLPIELIQIIIRSAIFSEPLGSHSGLHTIREMSQEDRYPKLKKTIGTVLGAKFTQELIHQNWGVHSDFTHAIACKHHPEQPSHGIDQYLPSRVMRHCHPCFQFLLTSGAILASSFNSQQDSLLFRALQMHNFEAGTTIISLMSYEELFHPVSGIGKWKEITVLQESTGVLEWFKVCWPRVKLDSRISLSYFGRDGVRRICSLGDVDIAEDLLQCGLDLGASFGERESPAWGTVLVADNLSGHEKVKFWDWLAKRHQPPAWLLEGAVQETNIHAVRWLMNRAEARQAWQAAARSAAERMKQGDAEVFEAIIRHSSVIEAINAAFLSNLLEIIVQEVRETSAQWDARLSNQTTPAIQRILISQRMLTLEPIAVRKINTIRSFNVLLDFSGLQVQTKEAGLYKITEALENGWQCNLLSRGSINDLLVRIRTQSWSLSGWWVSRGFMLVAFATTATCILRWIYRGRVSHRALNSSWRFCFCLMRI